MAGSKPFRNAPVSRAELERRWSTIRTSMRKSGIDVLVAQGNNDFMAGHIRYLTDHPASNGYPTSVVFPIEGGMTFVRQGPFGNRQSFADLDDALYPGVAELRTTPSFVTAPYTWNYDAELLFYALQPFARSRIGLLSLGHLPYAFVEVLKARFPEAEFVDASDLVDRVRAIKSAEEIDAIRVTTRLQDQAMTAAFAYARPGMREAEIAAEAIRVSLELGSEQGIYLCASGPEGAHLRLQQRHYQQRVLEPGDHFILLVENNGPGGQYAELGRTLVLGKASDRLKGEMKFTIEAREFVLDQIRPGIAAAEVYERYSRFMEQNGRPRDTRIFAHSQGCDMVERPLLRQDEDMTIESGMNLAIHPSYHHGVSSWICDNFLVEGTGRPARLHALSDAIVEI
jgi:Xaa-Pro aminopeptidase